MKEQEELDYFHVQIPRGLKQRLLKRCIRKGDMTFLTQSALSKYLDEVERDEEERAGAPVVSEARTSEAPDRGEGVGV